MKNLIDYLKWLFDLHRPKCEHTRQRCIHGDEINWVRAARSACLDCFALFEELPEHCYYTKQRH